MRDCLSFDIQNNKVMLSYACLLCQLGRSAEAAVLFKNLLDRGFEVIKVQVLLSIANQMAGDQLTSQKYKAMSNITYMREQSRVPKQGSLNQVPPKASQVMKRILEPQVSQPADGQQEVTNEVASQVAFDGKRLSDKEQD